MKIVFFGTPDYVVPVLDKLHREFKLADESPIAAVVTQTPKPAGRDKKISYSPVDGWAHKKNIPIFYSSRKIVEENISADLGILASFGEFIPADVINHFKYGIINIHPSSLPEFRGSSPIQATIITNSTPAVSFIRLDEKLDHGPVLSQFKDELLPDDTSVTLRSRLFARSAEVLATLIPAYISGKVKPKEQNHVSATFTREIKKEDGFIPPKNLNATLQGRTLKGKWEIPFIKVKGVAYNLQPTTYNLSLFIRAMQPWPGAWTYVNTEHSAKSIKHKRLKILSSTLTASEGNSSNLQLSEPEALQSRRPTTYNLQLNLVQLEGKNPVSWKLFSSGYPQAKFE